MKRGRKTDVEVSESKHRVIWFEQRDAHEQLSKELTWVRYVLKHQTGMQIDVVNDLPAAIAMLHLIFSTEAEDQPVHLLIASGNRSDLTHDASQAIRELFPKVQQRFVLGEWWTGHKRTSPLPLDITSYYWYQAYDRLLKDLAWRTNSTSNSKSPSALVYSDNPDLRRLWLEALPELGVPATGIKNLDYLPEGVFKYLFIDGDVAQSLTDTDAILQELTERITSLRKRYSTSFIVVFFGFPQWTTASLALSSGADLIVGKPFDWDGLMMAIESFVSPPPHSHEDKLASTP